jgi:ribosome-binding factor A
MEIIKSTTAPSHRTEQLNEELRHLISEFLAREAEWPENSLATVLKVETTPNLQEAKIFVSVIPANQTGSVLSVLKRLTSEMASFLRKNMTVHSIPHFTWVIDQGEVQVDRLEQLISEGLDKFQDKE